MPAPPQPPGFSRPVRVDERPMPVVWLRPRRDLFLGSLTSLLSTEHELPPTQRTPPPAPPPASPPALPPPPAARATGLTASTTGSTRRLPDVASISLATSTAPASTQRLRFVGPPPQYEANFIQDRPTQPTAQPTTQGRDLRVRTQHRRPPNPTMPAVRFPSYVSRRLPVGQRLPPGAERNFISPRVYAAVYQGNPHKTQSEWNYQPIVPPAISCLRQPIPERLVLPTDILQGPPFPAYVNTSVSPRLLSDNAAFDAYTRECPLIKPTRQLSRVPEWSESAESEEEMAAVHGAAAAAAEAVRRRRAMEAAEAAVAAAERELRRPHPRPRPHSNATPKEAPQDELKASEEDVEAEEAEETDVEEKEKSGKEMETAANKMEETASKLEATQKHSMSSQTLEQTTMAPVRARDAACMDLSQPFVELVRSLPWDSVTGVRRIEEVFVTDASGGMRDIPPLPLSASTGWPGNASAPAPAPAPADAYVKPLPPPPPPPAQPARPVCTSARCACPVEKCRRAAGVEQGVQAPAALSLHSARLPATRPCAGYEDKVYQEVTLTMVPPAETASNPSEALVTCEDLEEKKSGKPPCESCSKHPEQPQIPPDAAEPPQASPDPNDGPPEKPSPPPEETLPSPEAPAEKKRRSKCSRRRSACRKNAKDKGVASTPEDTSPRQHAVAAQPSENIDLVTKASEGTVMEKDRLEEECKAQECRADCRDPRCRTTGVKAPEVIEPEVETPEVKEPEVKEPEIEAPEDSAPVDEVPDYEERKSPDVETTEDIKPEGKALDEVPPPPESPPPEEKVPEKPPPAEKKRRSKCFRRRSACSKAPPKEKIKDTKSVPESRAYEQKPPDDKAQEEVAPERKEPESVAPVPMEDRINPEDKPPEEETPTPESRTAEEKPPDGKTTERKTPDGKATEYESDSEPATPPAKQKRKCFRRRSACGKTPPKEPKRKRKSSEADESAPETKRSPPEDTRDDKMASEGPPDAEMIAPQAKQSEEEPHKVPSSTPQEDQPPKDTPKKDTTRKDRGVEDASGPEEDAPDRKRKGSKCRRRRSACSKTPPKEDKRKRPIPETRADERKVPEDIPSDIQEEDIPAEGIVPEEKVLDTKATECKVPECRSPGDKVPGKAVECKSAVCKSTGDVSNDTASEDESTAATTTPPVPKHAHCHAKRSSSKILPCLADTIAPPSSTQQQFTPNLGLRYSCCPPLYQRHGDYATPDLESSAGYPQHYRQSYRCSYPGPRYSYPPPYVTPSWQHTGYEPGYSGSYSYPPPAYHIRPRSASEPRSPQAAPAPQPPPQPPPPPGNVMMFDVVVRVIPRRHSAT